MFVLLFAFVFGGVIAVPDGGDYNEYLIGGILVQTLAFGMMGPAISIATDLGEGIVDRFSSLPMSRPAYLLGHLRPSMPPRSGGDDHGRRRLIVGWGIRSSPLEALAGFGLSSCSRSR